MRQTRHSLAFTIIELLMVIAIIGVVAAIVAPRLGAAMGGGRLRVGSRGVIQSARYARTMALLHQIDIDLILDATPEKGCIRVEAAPLSGERADGGATGRIELDSGESDGDSRAGGAGATSLPSSDDMVSSGQSRIAFADDGEYGAAVASGAQVSAAALADEIATEVTTPGCTYEFLGYTDQAGSSLRKKTPPPADGEEAVHRIRFRSNGTCRPFCVRVSVDDSDGLYVSFDILGTSTVSEEPPR